MQKTAVILSGGLGTRLKPFTDAIPKPLLPVGEKAVLEIQIDRLRDAGFTRIFLATNYKADYIEQFLVMNGDILSLVDYAAMYDFAESAAAKLTVGIKKMIMPFAFGNIFFEGDRVTGIEEKPDIEAYALAGIYVMRPEILPLIPAGEYYGMDSLMNKMLAVDDPIAKYEIEEYWLDIGRIDDYEKAQEDSARFGAR